MWYNTVATYMKQAIDDNILQYSLLFLLCVISFIFMQINSILYVPTCEYKIQEVYSLVSSPVNITGHKNTILWVESHPQAIITDF